MKRVTVSAKAFSQPFGVSSDLATSDVAIFTVNVKNNRVVHQNSRIDNLSKFK